MSALIPLLASGVTAVSSASSAIGPVGGALSAIKTASQALSVLSSAYNVASSISSLYNMRKNMRSYNELFSIERANLGAKQRYHLGESFSIFGKSGAAQSQGSARDFLLSQQSIASENARRLSLSHNTSISNLYEREAAYKRKLSSMAGTVFSDVVPSVLNMLSV